MAHFGLEHHESSDDRTDEDAWWMTGYAKLDADLLPHEFVHSWNGKFRRPAGLATPDYNEPMKGELLWVYEGLTEYLGEILDAAQRFVDAAGVSRFARARRRGAGSRGRANVASAGGYGSRGAGALRCAQGLRGSAARHRFLRRRNADLARCGRHSAHAEQRHRNRSTISARRSTGPPSTGPEVKPYTFEDVVQDAEFRSALRLGGVPECSGWNRPRRVRR